MVKLPSRSEKKHNSIAREHVTPGSIRAAQSSNGQDRDPGRILYSRPA